MIAITISHPGGPEVLLAEERPKPIPGAGEILIAVAAAGINRPDVMQRQGKYPPPPGASDLPGLEVSGTVAEIGRGNESESRWRVGDRVVALLSGGGYAEYCTVAEGQVLPLPAPLSLVEGAALPETTFTVWHNVFQRGRLTAGEWLLVHGGTSGIGTTAIQLAKASGALVAVTAGSEEKCAAARALGADLAINYKKADFVSAIHDATGGRGADVILDMVGGDYVAKNIEAAAEDGRIVQIAAATGSEVQIDLWKILKKRLTLTGSTLRSRSPAFKAELAAEIEKTVWPWIAAGQYKPVIDQIFPLDQVIAAHRRMDGGEHIGKILLTMPGADR